LGMRSTLLSLLLLAACTPGRRGNPPAGDEEDVMAVLYQQQAAEYKALCLQSYDLARRNVEDSLKAHRKGGLPLAVITDLDETALDNSPYQVWAYRHHRTYDPASWKQWCDRAMADTVPGALSFFNWAAGHHVAIFYVSNRDTGVLGSTMLNMRRLGFPQVDSSHFYLKTNTSSKEARRREIERHFDVVALLGDDLIDLDSAFDGASPEKRASEVYRLKDRWGKRYIVFPNAVYGDWEQALYGARRLSLEEKDSIRVSKLHGY